jgi:hypothetical protein
MPLWSRKKDANHNEAVQAFLKLGWYVRETWRAPNVEDLVVCSPDGQRVILVEVKSKGGKLSEAQQERFDLWPGETAIVTSVGDVLKLVQNRA